MSGIGRPWVFLGLAALSAVVPQPTRAGVITQTASLPLTPTDFGGAGAKGVTNDPLVISAFNSQGGRNVLDEVVLSFKGTIQNQFGMKFTTPGTITDTVSSGRATGGAPSITLDQPDGVHALVTVTPSDSSALSKSITYGSGPGQVLPQAFGAGQPASSPYYLAPAVSSASNTLTLTSPADLALFTGTGKLALPVTAAAFSSFLSSSGNGFGSVTTQGSADLTVTYLYHGAPEQQVVPEPATLALWASGVVGAWACSRRSRRRGRSGWNAQNPS